MDINQLYSAALAAQKSGQEAQAERLYRQILEQASPPEALVNLGNLLARQGRRDEALPLYDRALAARPDFLEGLFNRAGLLLELKRPEDALESYERVVALRPDLFIGWNNRGSALRALQRHEEALASFERAAVLNPSHVNALTNRAMALWDLRRLQQALVAANQALTAQPAHAEALYTRANILRDLGRMAEALADYEQVLAIQPAHLHALNGAAQAALALCDWPKVEALTPRVKNNASSGPALIQPYVLLGYDDDPALQRACAENYVRRTVPARATPTTASASPTSRPIFISIPPPSFWLNCSSATTASVLRSRRCPSGRTMAAPCGRGWSRHSTISKMCADAAMPKLRNG